MNRKPLGRRPALEVLEDRTAPATITWINTAGGQWDVASNWDLGRTPQTDDDVVIGPLNYNAVVEHARGDDTVQSISASTDLATLEIDNMSSLTVAGALDVPTLLVATGGVVAGNDTGSLDTNLRAESGGEIHLPGITEFHGRVFTSIDAVGAGSLIDLPGVTSLMATTGRGGRGEVRLDLRADQGGTVNLPALTSVRGHPPDYFVGWTALRASNGGTFLLDTSDAITFAAAGSLDVDPGSVVEAGPVLVGESGALTVVGGLAASSLTLQGPGATVTVGGLLEIGGSYTSLDGTTVFAGGVVTVGDLFDIQGFSGVSGSGVLNGNVRNAGDFSVLALTVHGNYTQTGQGTLRAFLGYAQSGGVDTQLVVDGLAILDGTLDVQLARGFQPRSGDQFQVLLFGTGRGTFANQTGSSPLFTFVYVFGPGYTLPPGLTLVAN
jgi:hypothetical protein